MIAICPVCGDEIETSCVDADAGDGVWLLSFQVPEIADKSCPCVLTNEQETALLATVICDD